MTEPQQCPICIESFNLSIRKKIECIYCHYEACSSCIRQYLLTNIQDPHCMSCRRSWNREIMVQFFPSSFVNKDYKLHRERVLYERECSLLPQTQAKVARIKARRDLETEQLRMTRLYNEKKKELKDLGQAIMDVQQNIRNSYNTRLTRTTTTRVEIIRKCPQPDCRGFIQKNHTCGICNIRICTKCHEILKPGEIDPSELKKQTDEAAGCSAQAGLSAQAGCSAHTGHECKPEDIETAAMILKQTRPCPTCFVSIYKIDGCDQMWCTQCHTAFSWRTGAIETMRIHNPHFYQWQMERANAEGNAPPREVGDIPCGGLPTIYEIRRWFNYTQIHDNRAALRAAARRLRNIQLEHGIQVPMPAEEPVQPTQPAQPTGFNAVLSIHRIVLHVESAEMRRFRVHPYTDVELNEELRIDYLLNVLTEDNFKKQLQQIEKKRQKKSAIFMILEMFVHTSGDIFRNYIQSPYNEPAATQMIQEFISLRDYLNQQLRLVSRQFNCKVPNISPAWGMMTVDYKSPQYQLVEDEDGTYYVEPVEPLAAVPVEPAAPAAVPVEPSAAVPAAADPLRYYIE